MRRMFSKAKDNIGNEFDIIRIMKTIRRVDLLIKVLLSKYQTFFIPAMRHNILYPFDLKKFKKHDNKDISQIRKIDDEQLKLFITELVW